MEIHGTAAPEFEPVRAAFERCFDELGETGAATAIYLDGTPVLDLWGGEAAARRPWSPDTLVHVYSVTKPFAAVCSLRLVEQGLVDLDAPVASYWPEFATAGKAAIPVRWLLTHQSGLLGIRQPLPREAIFDWERVTSLLAAEGPWWEPGTRHGEHAYFFGHLLGEVVRRVTGNPLGRFFRDEIATPWGLDFHIGLTPAEEARCATVTGIDDVWRASLGAAPGSLYSAALDNPPAALYAEVVNSSAWRRAEVPAVNGHGTARAIARFYAGIAAGGELDGVRLLSPSLAAAAIRPQSSGVDFLLGDERDWGLGFAVDFDGFGMGGIGGALGWGNAEHRFGFAYVTNRMAGHDRSMAVFEAASRVVGLPQDPAPTGG